MALFFCNKIWDYFRRKELSAPSVPVAGPPDFLRCFRTPRERNADNGVKQAVHQRRRPGAISVSESIQKLGGADAANPSEHRRQSADTPKRGYRNARLRAARG
jgi:hypothetical protein